MEIIDVIDAAVKIGFGAFVGGFFTYRIQESKQKHEYIKDIHKLIQENTFDPVLNFIDDSLSIIDEIYWSKLNNEHVDSTQKLVTLRNKTAMISARIAELGDEALKQQFSQFIPMLTQVRTYLSDTISDHHRAEDVRGSATDLAGAIRREIYALLSDPRKLEKKGRLTRVVGWGRHLRSRQHHT